MATAFVTKDVEAFNALASATRHELPEDIETRLRRTRRQEVKHDAKSINMKHATAE